MMVKNTEYMFCSLPDTGTTLLEPISDLVGHCAKTAVQAHPMPESYMHSLMMAPLEMTMEPNSWCRA